MAVSPLAHDVSDLCLGKPALRSLSVSTTVGDALSGLKRSDEHFLSVWSCDHHHHHHQQRRNPPKCAVVGGGGGDAGECRCVGKVCLADVIYFLAKEENLKRPSRALQEPVSVLVPKVVPGLVRHLEPHASLLEAIDAMLDGAQNLVIPIHSPFSRKKLIHKPSSNAILHNKHDFCWLTQEDIIRYLLNAIGLFSPTSNYTIESLNIIDTESILAVHFDDPASSVVPLISLSLMKQTSIAVLDKESRLIGEISPVTLNSCDESAAAAIATLTAGDLMAYIDCDSPPEDLVRLVKKRLEERNLGSALDLMEDESGISSSCSSRSSSDEEFGLERMTKGKLNGHSTRILRSPMEPIVCYPSSSLVAVMIQALSHRVTYMWVVEDDGSLAGVVTFAGIMKVFRERLKSMA